MRKVKKNNRPIIILIVGLLISSCLFVFSYYQSREYENYVSETHREFEFYKSNKKKQCEDIIASKENEIDVIENEIVSISKEITSLQRQKSEEFMNSRGWSDKYYALEDQITEKRNEQANKRKEITAKEAEIDDLEFIISQIENNRGEYKTVLPDWDGVDPWAIFALGLFVVFATFLISGMSRMIKINTNGKSFSEYREIDEGELSRIYVNNGNLLKKDLCSRLEILLKASSNDDYDVIRKLCTKTMARSYIDELELLKKYNQKLVIKNIENMRCKIVEVSKSQHNIKITVVQKIKSYNYVKHVITNETVSGDDKEKVEYAFRLVFVKDFVQGHNVKKCPNCGANIKDATKVACDYCGTVFDNSNYDWYLESKVIINED